MAQATRKRTGRKAATEITVSEEQEFITEQLARPRRSRQSGIEGETDGITQGGVITHFSSNTVVMYKPTAQGYMPRQVPVTAIQVNLLNGWKRVCPDCNGHHGSTPNACPGREPVAVRVCPICRKRIADPGLTATVAEEDDDDPNIIPFEDTSTPEQRSLVAWQIHMWLRHPRESLERRVPPLDTAYLADMQQKPSEAFGSAGSQGVVG